MVFVWATILFFILVGRGTLLAQTPEEFLRQSSQLVSQFQWSEATRLLDKALDRYPDEPDLLLQLGSLLVRSGQASQGEPLLQRALEFRPESLQIILQIAEARLAQGQIHSAVALLKTSVISSPKDAALHHSLAFGLMAEGKDNEALGHAQKATALDPLNARFRRLYALLLETLHESEDAYDQLTLSYRLDPQDPTILFNLSQRTRFAGDLEQSLEFIELAIEQDPENPLYHERLSEIYSQLGESERASRAQQQALTLKKAFDSYFDALHLSVKGRKPEAIKTLEPIISNRPEFITGMLFLADLYLMVGKQDQSLDLYLKILDRDPTQSLAREKGAWIQVRQGLYDAALNLVKGSGFRTPDHTLISAYRFLAQENWTAALKELQKVEFQNPLNPDLLKLISFCLNAQGNHEDSLRQLNKAETLRPDDPEIVLQKRVLKRQDADNLLSQKNWKEALQAFKQLFRDDVQVEYLFHIAYCHQQLGHIKKATDTYRRALEIEPGASWARVNFATSLYLLREYSEAAQQWELILKETENAQGYLQLGQCYSHLSRFPEANYAFEKALQLGERSPQLFYYMGLVRLRLNRPTESWPLIRRAAREGYSPAQHLLQQAARRAK